MSSQFGWINGILRISEFEAVVSRQKVFFCPLEATNEGKKRDRDHILDISRNLMNGIETLKIQISL